MNLENSHDILENVAKLAGKYLCQSFSFNKFADLKRLWHRCFPVNFAKFLKTPILKNTSGRPLLKLQKRRNKNKKLQTTDSISSMIENNSFPSRISSVNVTKSVVSCRFGHIY